ncbi:unnamed protein product [Rotaria sp. Silwood2]|nr:unnamed protein product [Rotaria sp. Silwood2]CAF4220218.1 unnamed protein product [Rotaria sp. Silwood2]CAF4630160.1 unnamed protein product [Rotaria sp. Silwood2]
MKVDFKLIQNNIRENLLHEKKSLQSRQQNELNNIQEIIEREKQELQKKLSYLNFEQRNNTNIQIRLLQMKHEFYEKLRNVENRYKNEIEDLTRRYEQMKVENDTLEKRLKEVLALSLTLFFNSNLFTIFLKFRTNFCIP